MEMEALLAKIAALTESLERLMAENEALRKRVAELEATNQKLTGMLFGRKSEKRLSSDLQPLLFETDSEPSDEDKAAIVAREQALALSDQEIVDAYHRRQQTRAKKPRCEAFPEHLERRDKIIDLDSRDKKGLTQISDSVTERLVMQSQVLYVQRLVQRRYVVARKPEAGVKAAPLPLNVVPGSKYDFSIFAALLAHKFGLHLPTYRSQDVFAGCGWAPSRSTINEIFNQADRLLTPLFWQMERLVLQDSIVLGDDTKLLLLTRDSLTQDQLAELERRLKERRGEEDCDEPIDKGSAATYAWLYSGLDDGAPYNVFHWTFGRLQKTVGEHLQSFEGTLVGDAFGGNVRLSKETSRIQFAACNAHARREFVHAEKTTPSESAEAIAFYSRLYAIEERTKRLSSEARLEIRQREAIPIWEQFRVWLEGIPPDKRLPKTPLGKAITYVNNQWEALKVYLTNGRIPIDNSQSERAIRPLTIGRKNWRAPDVLSRTSGRLLGSGGLVGNVR